MLWTPLVHKAAPADGASAKTFASTLDASLAGSGNRAALTWTEDVPGQLTTRGGGLVLVSPRSHGGYRGGRAGGQAQLRPSPAPPMLHRTAPESPQSSGSQGGSEGGRNQLQGLMHGKFPHLEAVNPPSTQTD